jgi:hypothetical protein
MKGVFKRNRPAPIPAGAQIVERDVQLKTRNVTRKFAVWTDEKGKLREAELNRKCDCILLPPGKNDPYYITYRDKQTKQPVTIKWGTDKVAAEEKRRELLRQSEHRAVGLVSKVTETATTPIMEVVDEWFTGLRATRASQQEMHVTRIIEGIDATRAHEIDAPKVLKFLGELRAQDEAGTARLSEITEAEYRQSIQRFTMWAAKHHRLPFDRPADLPKIVRSKAKRAHERRALPLDDLARLLEVTQRRTVDELRMIRRSPRKGQVAARVRPRVLLEAQTRGRYFRLAYLIAFYARLRRSEIKKLVWMNVRLEGDVKKIELRQHRTKARRGDSVPIHPALEEALREFWRPGIDQTSPVCARIPSRRRCGRTWRRRGSTTRLTTCSPTSTAWENRSSPPARPTGSTSAPRRESPGTRTPDLPPTTTRTSGSSPSPKSWRKSPPSRPNPIRTLQCGRSHFSAPGRFPMQNIAQAREGNRVGKASGPEGENPRKPRRNALNNTTPHRMARGRMKKRAKGVEPSTFTLAT